MSRHTIPAQAVVESQAPQPPGQDAKPDRRCGVRNCRSPPRALLKGRRATAAVKKLSPRSAACSPPWTWPRGCRPRAVAVRGSRPQKRSQRSARRSGQVCRGQKKAPAVRAAAEKALRRGRRSNQPRKAPKIRIGTARGKARRAPGSKVTDVRACSETRWSEQFTPAFRIGRRPGPKHPGRQWKRRRSVL